MGGRVGLKGTDGDETLREAKRRGAVPVAPGRAEKMLTYLLNGYLPSILTYPAEMGEKEVLSCGIEPTVLGSISSGPTTASDTRAAARDLADREVDLLAFVGGDGTANDIYDAIEKRVPILGVPAGVKVFSAVFANTPKDAAKMIRMFLEGDLSIREAEVMDVDEAAYRGNTLRTELKGYALTPYERTLRQEHKLSSSIWGSEELEKREIARCIVEAMRKDHLYILGPGTTTAQVANKLKIENSTLLGVDLIKNNQLLAADVGESRILEELENHPGTIIVSPIGKQGFILGRGNQQISPRVIRKVERENILVLATPSKLQNTSQLKVDTGDPDLDRELRCEIPVIAGYWLKRDLTVI